jgi:hypothetical protein
VSGTTRHRPCGPAGRGCGGSAPPLAKEGAPGAGPAPQAATSSASLAGAALAGEVLGWQVALLLQAGAPPDQAWAGLVKVRAELRRTGKAA